MREYTGHGIGRDMHEDPQIPNFGIAGHRADVEEGHDLCSGADGEHRQTGIPRLADNHWTVSTVDGSLSAHFEHTVAVTDGNAEVLDCSVVRSLCLRRRLSRSRE